MKRAKLKVLKADRKGNRPNHTTALNRDEEDMLFQSGQLRWDSPAALQRSIWWPTTIHFGHGGRDEARQLQWGDIQLKTDKGNEEYYLEFQERSTKPGTVKRRVDAAGLHLRYSKTRRIRGAVRSKLMKNLKEKTCCHEKGGQPI